MGDLAIDTAVEGTSDDGHGEYTARLSRDWEIWGPNGGYLAAVLLRAAGTHSQLDRPASLAVHFLGGAAFDEVTIGVETLRRGRRSESVRLAMSQGDRRIAEAMVWTVDGGASGPEYEWTPMPDVPAPSDLSLIQDLVDGADPPHPFWSNFEFRPLDFLAQDEWDHRSGLEPTARGWWRFVPTDVFDDPFVEAGRVAVLLDTEGWPAAARGFDAEHTAEWMAPNMDVHITFHDSPDGSPHLLNVTEGLVSRRGLVGAQGWVFSEKGRLLGTGTQQMLLREMRPPQPNG